MAKSKKVERRTIKSYQSLNELEKLSDHYSINEAEKSEKSENMPIVKKE